MGSVPKRITVGWHKNSGSGPTPSRNRVIFMTPSSGRILSTGKNIGRIDTLVEVANSVGLAADKARDVLETRQFQAAVDADWQRARALGITGVPTFVANGRGVVGAQPYEVLERLVLVAGGAPRHEEQP